MTFDEIGNMTLRQAKILLAEYGKDRKEKFEALNSALKKYDKGVFPVFDISAGIFDA